MTGLSDKHEEWLAIERGIDPEIVARMGIFSARWGSDGEDPVADRKGQIIAFPFQQRERRLAVKYRTADKRMWQSKNPEKALYNVDVLDDPALADGSAALVITEGEIDALSALTAGHPWAVSVPDGAPPARDAKGKLIDVPEGAGDVVPEEDTKYGYIFRDWDALAKVKRIVIATDNDEPGERLAAELVRRLGRVRCARVRYPKGCKDLNDTLLAHGQRAVLEAIQQAQPYPVSGLYGIDDLPGEPPLEPVTTGWGRLDDKIRVYRPCLMVVSGFANAGKSTWTTQLVANLAVLHGWSCAVASFEMRHGEIVQALERCAAEAFIQHRHVQFRVDAMVAGRRLVRSHFSLIAPAPDRDEETDVDWLLERATAAVIRHGIKVLVLDPWNEVEHRRGRDETTSEYTGRALRKIKRWAAQMEVLVIIVVHPTKAAAQKEAAELSLYDVADSAHFANKADLGVMIARLGTSADSMTGVNIVKVRYQPDAGQPGTAELVYDRKERVFGL